MRTFFRLATSHRNVPKRLRSLYDVLDHAIIARIGKPDRIAPDLDTFRCGKFVRAFFSPAAAKYKQQLSVRVDELDLMRLQCAALPEDALQWLERWVKARSAVQLLAQDFQLRREQQHTMITGVG